MVLCFAACGGENNESTKGNDSDKLVIAYSVPSLANEFWVNWTDAMKAECEELGYEFIVEDAKSDVANQVTQLENWITRGVDAIIIAPVDAEAIQSTVDEAMNEGIPVINAATKLTNYTSYVGVDQYYYGEQIGKAAAAWVNEHLADKEEVKIAILTDSTQKNMITRTEGIKAGLADAKNIVIVAEQDAYATDAGMSAAENILQAHPDLDGFVGITDSAMCGAYQAVITSGVDNHQHGPGGLRRQRRSSGLHQGRHLLPGFRGHRRGRHRAPEPVAGHRRRPGQDRGRCQDSGYSCDS